MKKLLFISFLVLSLFIVACTPEVQRATIAELEGSSDTQDTADSKDIPSVSLGDEDGDSADAPEIPVAVSLPPRLAGNDVTPYYEFSQVAYEQALADNKKVFLQWYATWCPSCRAEQKIAQPYFDSLNDEDIVGFRVNFKDKDTSKDEENLAREFGVSTQSTKIFIVNGERVHKTPQHYVTNTQYKTNFATYFG